MQFYNLTTYKISELITKQYSTSFFSATSLLDNSIKKHIFNIYGFVRFADEIVDTFHDFDKKYLLEKFEKDYYEAINIGISLNPVLHAFQLTVKQFDIPDEYIREFLDSMKLDLEKKLYNTKSEIEKYIYGSADVVGLMCLKVFCNSNNNLFEQLKLMAIKLGSAFQKVNFLRDLKNDIENLDRNYFSELGNNKFNENTKNIIIKDIENDFNIAFQGIKLLPSNSKLAVLVAYNYYLELLKKIKNTPAQKIISQRIRVSNSKKFLLVLKSVFVYKFKII